MCTDDAQGVELCTQVVGDEHKVDFQVHKVVADVHKVQVARCAASMGLVASSVSLLRRLIFLTVVYGRTAVRRRKVDGKICFPAACQKLDEGGKQNLDCQDWTTKFLAVIGAVVVASQTQSGQSVVTCHPCSIFTQRSIA